MNPQVEYKRLYDKAKNLTEEYKNSVYAISSSERCYVFPGERKLIKTFLEISIPENYFGIILSRKDSYIKNGLYVFQELILPNTRKELQLAVMNVNIPKGPIMMSDNERFFGEKTKIDIYIGDRIANMILIPITEYSVKDVTIT